MVSVTLAMPEELKKEMDLHPELNWSEVARQAIRERIKLLARMDELLKNSKLTEQDAISIGRKVNAGLSRRYKEVV